MCIHALILFVQTKKRILTLRLLNVSQETHNMSHKRTTTTWEKSRLTALAKCTTTHIRMRVGHDPSSIRPIRPNAKL
jgi:hypothetical protein